MGDLIHPRYGKLIPIALTDDSGNVVLLVFWSPGTNRYFVLREVFSNELNIDNN